jgi:hypothetical protein
MGFNFPFWSLNTIFLLVNVELVYINGTVWFCVDGFSFFFVAEFKQGDNNTEDAPTISRLRKAIGEGLSQLLQS